MKKKLSAILLLALFLFNMAGYKVLFYYLQQRADQQMMAFLDDAAYDETALITITIPISLPYQNDWSDFERVDGEINYEGVIYKYVKRKVSNGQLVLLCLPDNRRTELDSAKDAFYKFANDLMQQERNKKPVNPKVADYHSISDCQTQTVSYIISATVKLVEKHLPMLSPDPLPTTPHLIPEHPPQA